MGKYTDIRRGKELNAALDQTTGMGKPYQSAKQTLYKGQRGSSVKVKATPRKRIC